MVLGLENISTTTINLVAAVITLIIGLLLGRFLGNLTRKLVYELELNRILKEKANVKIPLGEYLSLLVKYITYTIAIILSLNQLGLKGIILNIILIILTILLIIFMILSLKDFVPNLMAGLTLTQKRNIKPGNIIELNNIEGEVINITLLETKLRTRNGDVVYIPNSILTKTMVIKKR